MKWLHAECKSKQRRARVREGVDSHISGSAQFDKNSHKNAKIDKTFKRTCVCAPNAMSSLCGKKGRASLIMPKLQERKIKKNAHKHTHTAPRRAERKNSRGTNVYRSIIQWVNECQTKAEKYTRTHRASKQASKPLSKHIHIQIKMLQPNKNGNESHKIDSQPNYMTNQQIYMRVRSLSSISNR